VVASVAAAAASSACCWLPVLAVGLGVGVGGAGAVFERYRWPLVVLSLALLALGFILNERAARVGCLPDGSCPPPQARRRLLHRVILGVAALGVVGFAFLPEILAARLAQPLASDVAARRPVTRLSVGARDLREAFDREPHAVRLVVLLSPT
jgi:hypothetical protein